MGSECSTARPGRTECWLPAVSTRAMSCSLTVEPPTLIDADLSSLSGRPAETESTTDSSCIRAERSARSTACRTASSTSARSTTVPPFMPRASVWPKPITSTVWLRRGSTSCGLCGRRRAIRQAILLVPTSSAATIAERFGDNGFIFGVRPARSELMLSPLSWPASSPCSVPRARQRPSRTASR